MSYENLLEMIRLALISDFSPAGKLRQIEAIIAEFKERQKQDEDEMIDLTEVYEGNK